MVFDRKRLIISLILGFFLLTGFMGAFGFAAATDNPDVRDNMTLPEQRVGDRLVYSHAVVRQDGVGVAVDEEAKPARGFEWLAPGTILDGEGEMHATNNVVISEIVEEGHISSIVYSHDRNTREMVAYTYDSTVPQLSEDGSWSSSSRSQYQRQVNTVNDDGGYVQPCWGLPLKAGETLDLTKRVRLFGDCELSDYWSPRGVYQAVGEETIAGESTVHFMRWDGNRVAPEHIVHVWLTDAHPYPVQVAAQFQDDPSKFLVMQLTSFRQGTQPVVWYAEDVPQLPPAKMVPIHDLSAYEAGIKHPFKLSEALALARADDNAAALHAWERNHPDAVVIRAGYNHQARESGDTHSWYVQLMDASARYAFHYVMDPPTTQAGLLPLLDEETGPSYRFQESEVPSDGFWPIENMPQLVPNVASSWARWQGVAGDAFANRAPNNYGFSFWCGSDECEYPVGSFDAGYDGTNIDTGEQLESNIEWYRSSYQDRPDQWELYETGSEPRNRHPGGGDEPTAAAKLSAETVDFDMSLWSFPRTAQATATAGVLSIMAAGVYYFWPAAKGLSFSLFSRVHDPEEMLEHPVRQSMHEAITAHPGIHIRKLRDMLNTGRGATDHHLRKLESVGLVSRVTQEGYTCLFVKGMTDHRIMQAAPVLKARGAQFLLQSVMDNPGCTGADVVRDTGLTAGTVNYHMKRLESAGLLEVLRDAGRVKLWPTAVAKSVVAGSNAVAA